MIKMSNAMVRLIMRNCGRAMPKAMPGFFVNAMFSTTLRLLIWSPKAKMAVKSAIGIKYILDMLKNYHPHCWWSNFRVWYFRRVL